MVEPLLFSHRQCHADGRNTIHATDLADRMGEIVRKAWDGHLPLIVDVIGARPIGTNSVGNEVKLKDAAGAPRDVVVGAGRIAAHANRTTSMWPLA
jgi:hypothetical protein